MHPTFGMELFVWLLIIVVIPVGVAVVFGTLQFRRMEKLVFQCQKCHEMWSGKAHLPFPKRCPHCHAADWSVHDEHAAPRIGG